MPSPTDLDAAWSAWMDRSVAPPAELQTLVETLRDEADREAGAASFGADRAAAMAWQIHLAVALACLCRAAAGQSPSAPGLSGVKTLATLARAAEGEARAELVGLIIKAEGGAGDLEPACLAELAPLLDPATVRTWALEALSAEDIDTGDQGLLLGVLPEEDVAVLLPPLLERAAAIEDSNARWSVLLDLVCYVPARWERRAGEESRARHGVELRWFPDDASEDALEQAQADEERRHWGAPFTAWRLGQHAVELPESERGPLLDRAIDEFAAIALTPVSPGNDEGPFWAMARMLDEPQVRRALAIVDRMESADWNGNLGASRASLIARLALLGHTDEAELLIPRIGTVDPFATEWRARACGGILGARLVQDPAARFEALLARTADDPAHPDPSWRFRVLDATVHVFTDRTPPDAANVEAFISLARSFEPRPRQLLLEDLIAHFPGSLPVQRWLDLTLAECEGDGRVETLICLAEALRDAGLDPAPALRPLLAYMEDRRCPVSVWTFRDLCGFRAWIAPEVGVARWTDFLHHAADASVWGGVAELRSELPEILVWLAGPEAVLSVGRSLARAVALCE